MKQLYYLLFAFLMPFGFIQAVNPIVDYALFYPPNQSSYAEVYILIPGNSVAYVQTPEKEFQAEVEITLIFNRQEQIVQFDRYILQSRAVADSTQLRFDLFDLKRFELGAGTYNLEVIFNDVHVPNSTVTRKADLIIEQTAKDDVQISMSDVILVNGLEQAKEETKYSKHGYNLVPNVLGYYPSDQKTLSFYAEVYNSDKILGKDADFMYTFSVVNSRKTVVNNLKKFKKLKAESANILMAELDISTLPSGNYFLWIEIRNKQNEVLNENAVTFYRNNPIEQNKNEVLFSQAKTPDDLPDVADDYINQLTDDQVKFYLASIAPIASDQANQFAFNALASNNTEIIRRTLSAFWRQQEPLDPALGFSIYREKADYVETTYKTLKLHGFETDRGRVFLKYGNPNDFVSVPAEAGSLPYEIWHYYRLNNKQTNIKFVFVKTIIASNNFDLIHSDARGEVKDPRWQMRINNQKGWAPTIDDLPTDDNFGRKSGMYFNE